MSTNEKEEVKAMLIELINLAHGPNGTKIVELATRIAMAERRAERERCAQLAEAQRHYCYNSATDPCRGGGCDGAMALEIAKKIREGR